MMHESFAAAGWAALPGLLDLQAVRDLSTLVNAALAPGPHAGMNRRGNDLAPLRWNDPVVARMLGSERCVGRIRAALDPPDLKWLSGYVSTKAPRTPALWWHQDWWCWDHPVSFHDAPSQVALLCYLGDTDAENGTLRLLPGSHRRSLPIHAVLPEPHGPDANTLAADHPAMMDCAGQVTFCAKAGDAALLDYRLLHGTHPNCSERRRDCVLLSFI